MFINIVFIIIGFILLIEGANLLVEGASNIAKKTGIPEIIVGLTVVSIGTSMPELFVSITSSLNNHADMALGNVIGSNICNLLLILGLSSVIRPIKFNKQSKLIDIPLSIFLTIVFILLCNLNNDISKMDSIILLVMFVLFIIYLIVSTIKNTQLTKNTSNIKVIPNLIYIFGGIVALKYGGNFVVDNASSLARILNISEKIISLTIVALGTSLPELITSVTASIKNKSDIALGNIIGSNIFNFLLITGASGLIKPLVFNKTYNIELFILLIATIALGIFPFTDNKDEMTTSNGITYLMLFGLYMIILFIL